MKFSSQLALLVCAILFLPLTLFADGKVVPPRNYKGSLEEKAQEAILIFHGSKTEGEAVEDMILKIDVAGDAENFAWIIPLPNEPETAKEDPKLFKELFDYVEYRKRSSRKRGGKDTKSVSNAADGAKVEVLRREIVGDYEIATVRETAEGGLNPWLESEGYQTLKGAEDVLKFYRDKEYVFVCIKVSSEALANKEMIESHPLRFTFRTGGRDGIFFPMKLTGLQSDPFDVNLYVFYRAWLNDKNDKYGFMHRGMTLRYRDWDSANCKANAGKMYSLPEEDPFLKSVANRIPTVKKLFQKLHPGERYYLTNVYASQLEPDDVRNWSDDLWMFPNYTNKSMVPYDMRDENWVESTPGMRPASSGSTPIKLVWYVGAVVVACFLGLVVFLRSPTDEAQNIRPQKK